MNRTPGIALNLRRDRPASPAHGGGQRRVQLSPACKVRPIFSATDGYSVRRRWGFAAVPAGDTLRDPHRRGFRADRRYSGLKASPNRRFSLRWRVYRRPPSNGDRGFT